MILAKQESPRESLFFISEGMGWYIFFNTPKLALNQPKINEKTIFEQLDQSDLSQFFQMVDIFT